ncbi:hypothetical protein J5N97_002895 [Dioscorea zingiberensis]|uniref:Myb-like domain-containing protein n=1 Tax=Dioscorea zingiberensis TaxID=325984 RepID=A0A9D5D4L1_9LILI|nr:hypothetical protein J5N97_002895 [Dioscorea zingiberensis]
MTAGPSSERHLTAAPPPRKSAPGQPWSHAETLALIAAYEEKWNALRRGQLKAQQWEEVAATVAARCGAGAGDSPSKSGTQCRHKIEKLRKRYRAERQRPIPSLWPYFAPMDRLERGPLPLSSRPPLPARPGVPLSSPDDDSDDPSDGESDRGGSNTRSISGIMRGFPPRVPRNPNLGKRRDFDDDEDEDEESEDVEDSEGEVKIGAMAGLAAVVRRFAEGFERLEKRRMEMMREVERDRMEMEARREEMVLESQRCLVESIAAAFAAAGPPAKKAKKSED